MLEKCLAETDPETTDVVVMTAIVLPTGSARLAADDHRLRPAAPDGGRQPGRARRQAGQAADRADQRAVLRPGPDGQDDRRPGADHGAVEQVRPRRPARPGGALLVQRLRGPARAADRSACWARTATSGSTSPAAARSPSLGDRGRRVGPDPGRAADELARRRAAAPGLRRQPALAPTSSTPS